MTVSSQQSEVPYAGDGVTKIFPIPFYFLQNSDIQIVVNDALGNLYPAVQNVDYTVTGAGNQAGGTATFGVAPINGRTITIQRIVPATQLTDYQPNDDFPAETHERALDKLTMLVQQVNAGLSRALVRPVGKNYYDAGGRQIKNVADPTDQQDAATMKWTDQFVADLISSITGPVSNAANVFYQFPDGSAHVVQDLSSVIGARGIGNTAGTLQDTSDGVGFVITAYGAKPQSGFDNTAYIQIAVDAARAAGGYVIFPPGEFEQSGKVEIRNGVRGFKWSGGSVKFTSVAGGYRLRGIRSGETENVKNFVCSYGRFDANNLEGGSGLRVFEGENCQDCKFIGNRIINMVHGYGILLFAFATGVEQVSGNTIAFNNIRGIPGITKDNTGIRWYPISIACDLNISPYADAVSYYVALGVAPSGAILATRNAIVFNELDGGYYGITNISALYSEIVGNWCRNNIRGIAMEWTSSEGLIALNQIRRNVSAGILAGYGCRELTIDNNRIYPEDQWIGEALIKVGLSSPNCKITNNKTKTSNNVATGDYHIYVHCDSSDCVIEDNDLAGDCYRAYIGVESAWNSTQTAIEHFAQGKGSSLNDLTNANMNNVTVRNNDIRAVSTKSTVPTALYFGQINDNKGVHSLTGLVVDGNTIYSAKHVWQMKVIEMNSGSFANNVLKKQVFERASTPANFSLPRFLNHFLEVDGNMPFDSGWSVNSLPMADTTPSVGLWKEHNLANTAAVSVTNFDDGTDRRDIRIRLDGFTTLVHNAALMRLKGNANVAPSSTNNFITLRRENGVWLEVGRNF